MEDKAKLKEGLNIDESPASRKKELDMEGLGEFNKVINDSFDTIFNKELDLEIEEVPMVLFELHENALYYIDREEWDKALVLLQKAQIIIEQANVEKFKKDRLIIIIIFHNTALWYQMLGSLEDSALFLETCILNLEILSMMPLFQKTDTKSKILSLECLLRMQLWALLSQLHRHQEALYHGQIAVRISHFLMRDLKAYIKSLVYREHFDKLEKDTNLKSRKLGVKQSLSRIELKSNKSIESLKNMKSPSMKSGRDSKREVDGKVKKGDKIYNENDNSNQHDDNPSIDSMENEIETMSILVKGYKKIYPLIEFLEKYIIQEYTDEEEGYNGIPMKVNHNSDTETENGDAKPGDKSKPGTHLPGKQANGMQKQKLEKVIFKKQKRFIKRQLEEAVKEEGVNAENLLGFINQKKLNSYLNISNIMRLKKLDFKDVYSTYDLDLYLLRESVLERFMLVITSYFCMGTELRFLRQLKVQGFKDSVEAQFWHGRALEMAISLFPGDSPLVKHIIQSYQKHHAPSSEIIPEDYSISHEVKVAKPCLGVHSNKAFPMIQNWDYIYDDELEDEESKQMSEFERKKLENKRNWMIRITSLDMPKNDYMKFVRKVIAELHLKDSKLYSISKPFNH